MALVNVDVDVELDEFDDDELITELQARGFIVSEESSNIDLYVLNQNLIAIFDSLHLGKKEVAHTLLCDLAYKHSGRILF